MVGIYDQALEDSGRRTKITQTAKTNEKHASDAGAMYDQITGEQTRHVSGARNEHESETDK
jgi:hypothetical protein